MVRSRMSVAFEQTNSCSSQSVKTRCLRLPWGRALGSFLAGSMLQYGGPLPAGSYHRMDFISSLPPMPRPNLLSAAGLILG